MTTWYILIGALLILMVAVGSRVERLPLTSSMLYLAAGILLGPWALDLVRLHPLKDARFIEHAAEVAVLLSLFTAGLKLRVPFAHRLWRPPIVLATATMVATTAIVALAARWVLDFPWGAAILLGAILAPTDPVLASDVQTKDPNDKDPLRFSLTAEAGLNDGTAFPLIMLGLGGLGLHELGNYGTRWLLTDVLWASLGGIAVGFALGASVARFILYLRRRHREAVGTDDFLALGLIALAYGIALSVGCYGFLAVFAAGLALRRIEREKGEPSRPPDPQLTEASATDAKQAPAYMAQSVLQFNEQMERLGEVAVVLLLGILLAEAELTLRSWIVASLTLLVARPLAVYATFPLSRPFLSRRPFIAWFGMRGIGSLYYLAHALNANVPDSLGRPLSAAVLATIALSIVVHGLSVTPLMKVYQSVAQRLARSG